MSQCKQLLLAALLTAALLPGAARAQFEQAIAGMATGESAGQPAISGTGRVVVRRNPTQLRLYIQLLAKGKSLEDAIVKLKDRKEAATTQLQALRADKKSIVFDSPSLSNAASARKQQLEAMVMEQMRSRGKKVPKGLQPPQSFTVSANLTAEWPLKAESPEQLLILAQGIQEKIKAADLAGTKEMEKLTPEEQEFEEEANQANNRYGGGEAAPPGQPHFVFVAAIPKAEREKAMAEAVARAKQRASELAAAAGVEVGPLIGLSGHCSGQSNFSSGVSSYDPYNRSDFFRQLAMQARGDDPDGKQDESLSPDPGELTFFCVATVLFRVGK